MPRHLSSRANGQRTDPCSACPDSACHGEGAARWVPPHWSCRKLATALHLSKDTVHRVWKEAGLKPHCLERYMASDDPEFEAKAADIIGIYLRPPHHAAVFCVDEKTAIQALDRLAPVLPLSPGCAERHGFEYSRRIPTNEFTATDH